MDIRHDFHKSLEYLEREVLSMGAYAEDMVERSVSALVGRDEELAAAVVAADDELDDRYLAIEKRWLETMALQTPVATDLRLMSVVLHTAHSVERIGDQAVSTASAVAATHGMPSHQGLLDVIEEIGRRVAPMVRAALEALEHRDLDRALSLPGLGEPVERLERSLFKLVAETRGDAAQLEWAVRMTVVARNLGRVGARAVDIAEQVAFLLSGVFREFTATDWDPQSVMSDVQGD